MVMTAVDKETFRRSWVRISDPAISVEDKQSQISFMRNIFKCLDSILCSRLFLKKIHSKILRLGDTTKQVHLDKAKSRSFLLTSCYVFTIVPTDLILLKHAIFQASPNCKITKQYPCNNSLLIKYTQSWFSKRKFFSFLFQSPLMHLQGCVPD